LLVAVLRGHAGGSHCFALERGRSWQLNGQYYYFNYDLIEK
jgi:hypothetical protein